MREPDELLCVRSLNMLTRGIDQDPRSPIEFSPVEEHIIEQFQSENHRWISSRTIVGFGVGRKRVGKWREETDQFVLKVYVNRKLPLENSATDFIPPTLSTPVGDIETDVLESGNIHPMSNLKNRLRPARPGLRIGLDFTPEGTFGCLTKRLDDDDSLYLLSNCHVIGGWGMKDGNGGYIYANKPVLQPMGGSAPLANEIAKLSYWVDFKFGDTGYANLVDAAIAKVAKPELVASSIIGSGIPTGIVTYPTTNVSAKKTGFATGVTFGSVTDIDFVTVTKFPVSKTASGRVEFSQQIVVTPEWGFNSFSDLGDSGAVVLDEDNRLIGLLWGGTTCEGDPPGLPVVADPCGVCNNINNVFAALSLGLP